MGKDAALAAAAFAMLLAVGISVAKFAQTHADDAKHAAPTVVVAAPARAPEPVVETCNQYAAQARRDPNRILRDGVVGGAVGAGVGAAGGAIADGGDGAGKGAGIGALVGAAAGSLFGL